MIRRKWYLCLASFGGVVGSPKGQMQFKNCQRSGYTQRNCGYAQRCVACGASIFPVEQPQCCGSGGNHMANYRGCVMWKEAKAALGCRRPSEAEYSSSQATLPFRNLSWSGTLPSRWNLARVANTPFDGACRYIHLHFTPNRNPSLHPLTQAPEQAKLTANWNTARPTKPEPNPTVAPKPRAPKPQHQIWWSPPKIHVPTRVNILSNRSPSIRRIFVADSSASHVHLLPPHRGS